MQILNKEFQPGMKVKYREGVLSPGLRNFGAVGEILERRARFGAHGQSYIRWSSGEETEEYRANLEIVSE